jgi:signal transduction histidine kinase
MTLLGLRNEYRHAIATTELRNDSFVIALEQYTRRTFEGGDAMIRHLTREYLRAGETMDLAAFMSGFRIVNDSVVSVVLADPKGNAVTTTGPGQAVNFSWVGDREHFRTHIARDSGALFVGKPVIGRFTGLQVIPLTRRITRADGSFAGVAMAVIETARITDVLEPASLQPLDIASVIGLDGITRARLSGRRHSAGEDISASPLFAEIRKAPVGRYQAPAAIDARPRFFSYRVLPEYGVVATFGTALEDAFADYRSRRVRYLAAATLASLGVAGFTAFALMVAATRRRVELELRRNGRRLQRLSRGLMSREEESKRTLSRELHDRIGGTLHAIIMALDAERASRGDPAGRITDAIALAQEMATHVRDILAELRPPGLDEFGLAAALNLLARATTERNGVEVTVDSPEPTPSVPADAQIALYRIAEEATGNALRHGAPNRIELRLREEPAALVMEIEDDGRGFDVKQPRRPGALGLLSLRERAESIGATIGISSSSSGTTVRVVLPASGPELVAEP